MVQKIFGHAKPDMTDRYCEYPTKQMKVALESVVGKVLPFGKSETIGMQQAS
jgi:hypothetical protein